MAFRLITLLYLVALLGASLALFGAWGFVVVVPLAWLAVRKRWEQYFGLVVVILICGWLAIGFDYARQSAQSCACRGHIYFIATCILNYHDTNNCLPPVVSSNGTAGEKQSWRWALLPFIEWPPLFAAYNVNEPWNGPNNRTLGPVDLYECPTHGHSSFANYLAITGPQTAWGSGEPRMFDDITDGLSQTILLIDTCAYSIDWREPRDLSFDQAVELLTRPVDPLTFDGHYASPGMFRKPYHYRNIIMADRSCYQLRAAIDRELAVALLTASRGEEVDLDELDELGQPEWDYARIYAAVSFVFLAMLPIVPAARRRLFPMPVEERNTDNH